MSNTKQMSAQGGERAEAAPCRCPQVTVDVVIFALRDDDLQVLLVQCERDGLWAIPGGTVGAAEGLEAAAARTLAEETGVRDVFLEQLYLSLIHI